METSQDYKELFLALSENDARFLVVGAYAVMFHATPRYTKDMDVWIDTSGENPLRVYRALAEFGAPLHDLAVEDLATPGVVFQLGVEPNRIDILTEPGGPCFEDAWKDRIESTYGGALIHVISLEHLMETKRSAGRPQDLLDLENLEKVAGS